MAYEVKFMGLSKNSLEIIGRVVEEPKFLPYGEGECAILQVKTITRNLTSSGQWVDEPNVVPITITSAKQVQTAKDYIKVGRQVMLTAYVKAWDANGVTQTANILTKLSLGDKPYEPEDKPQGDDMGNSGGGGLPPI